MSPVRSINSKKNRIEKMNKRSSWQLTTRRIPGFRETPGTGIGLLPLRDFAPRAMLRRKEQPMAECFVAKASELADGDRRIVLAGTAEIGVFYKDGAYFGYSNTCVHSGGPACEGLMINRVVDVIAPDRTYQGQTFSDEIHFVCPWHGYEYDLKTGECVGDRRLRLKKFEVIRRGEDVFVIV
jgi:nitrite reductase/ring-hydroxylating ferredoxin subunit